ncbi:hypothetical protein TrST_g11588 [Triparma strigata]|uniref:Uncharacterized protein n=1 Tax=Triparma strigata TaxID=1606541 RepID=A0A9W6ZMF6_9STRA|nr:hypothetical protein TrST_g11588 [Triparma strigata]
MSSTPPPSAPAMSSKDLASKFFGFQPETFCNTVFQSVDDYIADGMDAMEVAMMPSFPLPTHRTLLKTCNDHFIDTLTAGYDKNLDKFEIYVKRNVLCIDDNVVEGVVESFDVTTPGKKRKIKDGDVTESKKESDEFINVLPSSIPSKSEALALEATLSSLRQKLRRTKRSVQSLKSAHRLLNQTITSAGASHQGIKEAIEASEGNIGAPLHDTVSAVVMGKDGLEQLKKEGNLLIHAMGDEENVDSNVEVKGAPLVKTGTAKEVGDLNGILGGN